MPKIVRGVLKNSRREANFIAYYMRNENEEVRHEYIKQNIVGSHSDLLEPFVYIYKCDRYHRKNHYRIDLKDGVTPVVDNIMYQSRRNSDYLLGIPKGKRFQLMKSFIARSNAEILMPFVHIISHDDKYKEIHYEIRMPESNR